MATATQQSRSAQQPVATAPPKQTREQYEAELLNKILDTAVEFTPFMAKETIKLSPRLVIRFLCKPTKEGKVCSESDATRFVMLCKARGLNPWEGDAFIVGYDTKDGPTFNLITAHQAFLKRAEVHEEFDGMESGVLVRRQIANPETGEVTTDTVELAGDYFEKDDHIVGGWARVHFKTRKYPMYKRLKLETFNTGYGRWKADPAGMIVKCSEADALRSAFPNALGGMYLEGEVPSVDQREPPKQFQPPAAGRHSVRNGNGHADYQPPPEPTEQESRAELALQESIDTITAQLDAADTERDFQAAGAAIKQLPPEAAAERAALLAHYSRRYAARGQERQPGDDDE